MKVFMLAIFLFALQLQTVYMFTVENDAGETFLHFDFKTENGQQREEDLKYESTNVATNLPANATEPDEATTKSVEIRGGYSFISADGYEYTVKYKANEKGFQPYVTARKLQNVPTIL